MQQHDTQPTSEASSQERSAYTTPTLVAYGSVKALTAGGSRGIAESQRWQTHKRV
jgi:hypothetical protein